MRTVGDSLGELYAKRFHTGSNDPGKLARVADRIERRTDRQEDLPVTTGRPAMADVLRQTVPGLGGQGVVNRASPFDATEVNPASGPVHVFQTQTTDLYTAYAIGAQQAEDRAIPQIRRQVADHPLEDRLDAWRRNRAGNLPHARRAYRRRQGG
jgi:hypothetical protein